MEEFWRYGLSRCQRHRTGWRVKGQWIKYESLKNINFSTSAPSGHLPYEAHLTLRARRFNDLGFFSRLSSCNL
ncbi:MAG: hypothetical protein PUP91_39335 [Rhizonema sp. PD37]|nr:hypothetical protein [Rhizonema sp. PD37]